MVSSRTPDNATVITGLGVVSPLGNSFADVAESLLAGRSGVREIAAAAGAREGRQFAAPVTSIPQPTGPGDSRRRAPAGS